MHPHLFPPTFQFFLSSFLPPLPSLLLPPFFIHSFHHFFNTLSYPFLPRYHLPSFYSSSFHPLTSLSLSFPSFYSPSSLPFTFSSFLVFLPATPFFPGHFLPLTNSFSLLSVHPFLLPISVLYTPLFFVLLLPFPYLFSSLFASFLFPFFCRSFTTAFSFILFFVCIFFFSFFFIFYQLLTSSLSPFLLYLLSPQIYSPLVFYHRPSLYPFFLFLIYILILAVFLCSLFLRLFSYFL